MFQNVLKGIVSGIHVFFYISRKYRLSVWIFNLSVLIIANVIMLLSAFASILSQFAMIMLSIINDNFHMSGWETNTHAILLLVNAYIGHKSIHYMIHSAFK